jgi:hypothetical protein
VRTSVKRWDVLLITKLGDEVKSEQNCYFESCRQGNSWAADGKCEKRMAFFTATKYQWILTKTSRK